MGLSSATALAIRQTLLFSGRSSRPEFWYYMLFYLLMSFVLGMLLGLLGAHGASVPWVVLTLNLILFIPIPALSVRRLHDTNRSGYWFVCMAAIAVMLRLAFHSFLLFLVDHLSENVSLFSLFTFLGVIAVWTPSVILLVFYGKESDPNTNQYGPPKVKLGRVTDGGDDTKEVLPETEKQ